MANDNKPASNTASSKELRDTATRTCQVLNDEFPELTGGDLVPFKPETSHFSYWLWGGDYWVRLDGCDRSTTSLATINRLIEGGYIEITGPRYAVEQEAKRRARATKMAKGRAEHTESEAA